MRQERKVADSDDGKVSFWANTNCRKCYGRGFLGIITPNTPEQKAAGPSPVEKTRFPLVCRCVVKKQNVVTGAK